MRPTLSPWAPHAPRIAHPYLGMYEPSPVAVTLGIDAFSAGLFNIPLGAQAVAGASADWTPEEQKLLLKAYGESLVLGGFADSASVDGQSLYVKSGLAEVEVKTYGKTGNLVNAKTGDSLNYSTTPGDKTYPYVDLSKIKVTVLPDRPNAVAPPSPKNIEVPSSPGGAQENSPDPGNVLGAKGKDTGLPSWVPGGMSSVADLLKWLVLLGLFGATLYTVDFVTKD